LFCHATISPNLDIHLPELTYQTPFGQNVDLWADLIFFGADEEGVLTWKLDDFGTTVKERKICTGPSAGAYHAYAGGVIEAAKKTLGIHLEKVSTVGTLENAKKIASGDCDMGIVQADVYVLAGTEFQSEPELKLLSANKGGIAALYHEQVHILVNKNSGINSIADLAGKKVNVGEMNSGTYLTATKILNVYNELSSEPKYFYQSPLLAVDRVVDGSLDATFYVSAVPIPKFASLPDSANVTLIPATIPTYTTEYSTGTIPATAYGWLDTDITDNVSVWSVLTIAQSVDRTKLPAFLDAIYTNKDEYATKYHPKWAELNKTSSIATIKAAPTSGWSPEAAHYFAGIPFPTAAPEPYICSGGPTGTYSKVVKDLVRVIRTNLGFWVTEKHTNGSIDNLNKLYSGECAIAIMQDDVGGYATAMDNANPDEITELALAVRSVDAIMPLYTEHAQLIVNENSGIDTSADMRGKKFNMGPQTSGTFSSALTMLLINGLTMDDVIPSFDNPQDAVDKVISGEYDAMFVTRNAPVPYLAELDASTPLKIGEIVGPSVYVKEDFSASHYPWQDVDVPDQPALKATLFISPTLAVDKISLARFIEAVYAIPDDGSTNSDTWGETMPEQGVDHFQLLQYLYGWEAAQYFADRM
jgi:TRAP transporter TAXI family solute receptor